MNYFIEEKGDFNINVNDAPILFRGDKLPVNRSYRIIDCYDDDNNYVKRVCLCRDTYDNIRSYSNSNPLNYDFYIKSILPGEGASVNVVSASWVNNLKEGIRNTEFIGEKVSCRNSELMDENTEYISRSDYANRSSRIIGHNNKQWRNIFNNDINNFEYLIIGRNQSYDPEGISSHWIDENVVYSGSKKALEMVIREMKQNARDKNSQSLTVFDDG